MGKLIRALLIGLIVILAIVFLTLFFNLKKSKPSNPITKTSLNLRPGKCLILEKKYCISGKFIRGTDKKYGNSTYITLNPPPGTPILAPADGLLDKVKGTGDPYFGMEGILRTDSLGYIFIGDLQFDNMLQENVKKGDIIGYVGSTGAKNLNASIIFTINRPGPITDEDKLKKLFSLN